MNTDRNSLIKAFIQSLNIRVNLRTSVAEIKRILRFSLSFFDHTFALNKIRRLMFGVRCSMFSLLFLQQASASIQLEQIDLGALPVEELTSLTINLPFSGDSEWITSVESSCSCLGIDYFPNTVENGDNYFDITFTPSDSGSAEVALTISALNAQSGKQTSYKVPVAVVGFKASEPVQLHPRIQPINPAMLRSNSEQYTIIDIRGAASYKKARIPGSFEYTLDAFVALSEQFTKPVVLVGDGLLSDQENILFEKIEEHWRNSLFWLEGGLPAWMREGLPVQGAWPSSVDASTISLQRWLEAGGTSSSWEIVDLAGNNRLQNVFFGHTVHTYNPDSGTVLGSFLLEVQEKSLRSSDSRGILIIGDSRGLSYSGIEHNDKVSHTVPIYYLNQGDGAVAGWLKAARGVHNSGTKSYVYSSSDSIFSAPGGGATIRTGRRSGCRSCPKR